MHAPFARANAARHSVLHWTFARLGSRVVVNSVENFRNAFDRGRSFAITDRTRHARWILPCCLSLRKRAARRVNQSDSTRRGVERFGRDRDCVPVLFRSLCPKRKPLHAALYEADRPFSENDRLSVSVAKCPCSLGSSIRRTLTWRYCTRRRNVEILRFKQPPVALKIAVGVVFRARC